MAINFKPDSHSLYVYTYLANKADFHFDYGSFQSSLTSETLVSLLLFTVPQFIPSACLEVKFICHFCYYLLKLAE